MAVSNAAFQATVDANRARTEKLRGLLMSASRYVEGYAENDKNHPQARDSALELLADINKILKR